MKPFFQLPLVIFSAVILSSCNGSTSTSTFLAMVKSCLSPNLLGTEGQVVFLGPNDYSPGDLFTRAQDANKEWRYNPQFEYARQVGAETAKAVAKEGRVPVDCKLTSDTSFKIDASADAVFTAAALPATAQAGVDFGTGTVTAISARKVYVDEIPYFQPYTASLVALPSGHPARAAISRGGMLVSTAILVVEDYSVDVKYGPEFNTKIAADMRLNSGDAKNLKAGIAISAKDTSTLTFSIAGKTAVAIVARPVSGATMEIQSTGSNAASMPQAPAVALLDKRGGYIN